MTDYIYKAVSTSAMSLRTDHTTFAEKKGTCPAGTAMFGNEVWIAPADGNEVKAGDKWLRVLQYGSIVCDFWVAIIHKGVPYCTLTQQTTTPPPSTNPDVGKVIMEYARFGIYDLNNILIGIYEINVPVTLTKKI